MLFVDRRVTKPKKNNSLIFQQIFESMASSSPQPSVAAEDDFMRVLDEMNRLCGAGEESSPDQEKRDDSFLNNTSSPKLDQDPDPFEGIRYITYVTFGLFLRRGNPYFMKYEQMASS